MRESRKQSKNCNKISLICYRKWFRFAGNVASAVRTFLTPVCVTELLYRHARSSRGRGTQIP